MLKVLQEGKWLRVFWMVFSLYLVNCCVDIFKGGSNLQKETAGFNNQESIIELVVEKVLGYENAIPEFHNSETGQQHFSEKNSSPDLFFNAPALLTLNILHSHVSLHDLYTNKRISKPCLKISIPPPEFSL